MRRRSLTFDSRHPMTFDGLNAECWFITMHNNVSIAYIKNMMPGVLYSFEFEQDSVGHYFAWPSQCLNAIIVDPAPNSRTVQNFIANSSRQLIANMPGTWF